MVTAAVLRLQPGIKERATALVGVTSLEAALDCFAALRAQAGAGLTMCEFISRAAMELAVAHGVRTIAFPAISCGVYGYPLAEAAGIAVGTVKSFLDSDGMIERVVFACFGMDVLTAFQGALEAGG